MKVDYERLKACKSAADESPSSKFIFGNLGYMFATVFVRTPLTPNQITWIWGFMMVVSAILFGTGDYLLCVIAAVIWICAYAMDYTDGYIARYKEMKTKRGKYLDYMIHHVTYPLLMFCIGYGVYRTGGTDLINFEWFHDIYYIFLGALAGLSMLVIMDAVAMHDSCVEKSEFEDGQGAAGVEGKFFKNEKLFRIIWALNPLTFTNMMLMLLVFSLFNAMWLFIIIYSLGYFAVAVFRGLLMYLDL